MKYLTASCWIALYLSVVVLIGQILERVSARYPTIPEDQSLADLRRRFEANRQKSRCKRLEAVYEEAQEILREEKATRIIATLDHESRAWLLDAEEYNAAADGRRSA